MHEIASGQRNPIRRSRTASRVVLLLTIGTLIVQAQAPRFSISARDTASVRVPVPITILVFSDFESFPCARSASVLSSLLGENKQVRLIFKHAPAVTSPTSHLAHEAALAAGAQGKFLEMHDLLFANQKHLGLDDLIRYATEIHLDVAAFREALARHTFAPVVEHDLAEAVGLGVTTKPTFFINGRRLVGAQGAPAIRAVLDSVLAGIKRDPLPPASVPVEDISLEQAPQRGPISAPLTVVQFSDFECGFCQAEADVMKELMRAYPGRIRWAFKHYPLPFHKNAQLAHEAALAAGEQGKGDARFALRRTAGHPARRFAKQSNPTRAGYETIRVRSQQ
jgi:protein-disulfide isomerase